MDGSLPRLGDRSLFPKLGAAAYLNHAAVSPPSTPVEAAVAALLGSFAEKGVGAFLPAQQLRAEVRSRLAQLLDVAAEDLALVGNTSAGVTAIALCFPFERGDRVLLFDGEFPANVTPWQRAAELHGIELQFLPLADYATDDGPGLERLEQALAHGARLVAVSAVQFQTGLRMPLAEITELCHRHGARVFVDGIQACGVVPLSLRTLGVDYWAAGAHKWLMAPEGAGFVYARRDAEPLRPHLAGWLSHERALSFLLEGEGHLRYDRPIKPGIDFLESGTGSNLPVAGLHAALELLLQLGVPAIFEHVSGYLDRLEAGLVARGFRSLRRPQREAQSSLLCLRPPAGVTADDVRVSLARRGVICAAPDGNLRFSPHWPNALDEVEQVLEALDWGRSSSFRHSQG